MKAVYFLLGFVLLQGCTSPSMPGGMSDHTISSNDASFYIWITKNGENPDVYRISGRPVEMTPKLIDWETSEDVFEKTIEQNGSIVCEEKQIDVSSSFRHWKGPRWTEDWASNNGFYATAYCE